MNPRTLAQVSDSHGSCLAGSLLITELSAVNAMLAVIGEAPLSTLDGNALHADAVGARQALHNTSRSVQAEGWYFNTEQNYPFTPDRDGFITLPPNVVSVDIEPLNARGNVDVIVRGDRLYDLENHTFAFDLYISLVQCIHSGPVVQLSRCKLSMRHAPN